MDREQLAAEIIRETTHRKNVFDMVPEGASRILDVGCGRGGLLLRLQRRKGCTRLYGVEVNPEEAVPLSKLVDGVWTVNLEAGQDLPGDFQGFFNYLILHDVVEHFADPWYALLRLRRYLAPGGTVIAAVPNLHFWRLQREIMRGHFPYGHGLWHSAHLRWFTPTSFLELLLSVGLRPQRYCLEIPLPLDPRAAREQAGPEGLRRVQFPPRELQQRFPDLEVYEQRFPRDVSAYYPVFFAHKLVAACTLARPLLPEQPLQYECERIHATRQAMNLPYDVFVPPPMELLMGDPAAE
jgi:SAM-dependent methyltransferase